MKPIDPDDFCTVLIKKINILLIQQPNVIPNNDVIAINMIYNNDYNHPDSFTEFIGLENSKYDLVNNLEYFKVSSVNNKVHLLLGFGQHVDSDSIGLLLYTMAWEFDFVPKYKKQNHSENLKRFLLFYKIDDPDYFIKQGMPIKYHEKEQSISIIPGRKPDETPSPKGSL